VKRKITNERGTKGGTREVLRLERKMNMMTQRANWTTGVRRKEASSLGLALTKGTERGGSGSELEGHGTSKGLMGGAGH